MGEPKEIEENNTMIDATAIEELKKQIHVRKQEAEKNTILLAKEMLTKKTMRQVS